MSDETKPKPVSLRPAQERYAHVAQRMIERGNLWWDPVQVAALERRIKFVRSQLNLQKSVAPILPTKFAEARDGTIHHYRALIAGQAHTFIWSQQCRGLISFLGPGEIVPATPETTPSTTAAL